MSWNSWGDFWAMGGYALYVWGSYAVTFALLATEAALLCLRRRSVLGHLGLVASHRARETNRGTA
jgi:heme exporter protein D